MGSEAENAVRELLAAHPVMARDLPPFDPAGAPAEPRALFAAWLAEAADAGVLDAGAVTLSTTDGDGLPDARIVALRDVDPDGRWVFASDADSPKGRQLAAVPAAAMTFYWPVQGRQVRVRGSVERASGEVAAREFLSRSPLSRAAGLVARQSEPLASADDFGRALAGARRRVEADPEEVAPGHTVWRLRADAVEFWQGEKGRGHVRLRYDRGAGGDPAGWSRTLLWP
ncbi:pyridoxal 5'-phosphate synthase [Streptomyces sp. NPDC049881]|uniref:pyridoxine/pyridoxamine 5'-phosphate oxidase n=1 Tax=unclassified Streptomyces TaxID=2593676 RepID=UPI003441CBAB